MGQFAVEMPGTRRYIDHILIASVLLLTGIGLVTLFSASYTFAERTKGDGLYFFSRQLFLGAAGLVLFIAGAKINLDFLRKFTKLLILGCFILCCLTLIPGIGSTRNGASRWVSIGSLTYQPSEMVKLVLPLYLAHAFDKKGAAGDFSLKGILTPVAVTGLFAFLIYLQNNFSTAVFLVFNALLIFYFAGVRFRYFFSAVFILLPISVLSILTKQHRLNRLLGLFVPDWDPQGAGYQVNASLRTIGSGGFWGKGLGQGQITRKISSIPEIHSDFIFSSFAEESGFIGVLLFIGLFTVFAARGYMGSMKNKKNFNRLLGLGLVTIILTQSLLNIAIAAGAAPVTGLPLPFFSAGGSSLATTLFAAGLIVNVSNSRHEQAEV
ncbi:MAG: putative lipid II flippase FtsW [Treponema sp.]|jgi:cell division protein FtsW|nr:putative lipid II flippase FtsW [Treponema sp.]